MSKRQVQTRVHKEKIDYLIKKFGTNNIYRVNEQAVNIAYEIWKTIDKINSKLGIRYDDPIRFLGVVETIFLCPELSKKLVPYPDLAKKLAKRVQEGA